jgi:hypothetical protein
MPLARARLSALVLFRPALYMGDGLKHVLMKLIDLRSSPAGLTRGSIFFDGLPG